MKVQRKKKPPSERALFLRSVRREKGLVISLRIAVLVLFFALWELFAQTGVIDAFLKKFTRARATLYLVFINIITQIIVSLKIAFTTNLRIYNPIAIRKFISAIPNVVDFSVNGTGQMTARSDDYNILWVFRCNVLDGVFLVRYVIFDKP